MLSRAGKRRMWTPESTNRPKGPIPPAISLKNYAFLCKAIVMEQEYCNLDRADDRVAVWKLTDCAKEFLKYLEDK